MINQNNSLINIPIVAAGSIFMIPCYILYIVMFGSDQASVVHVYTTNQESSNFQLPNFYNNAANSSSKDHKDSVHAEPVEMVFSHQELTLSPPPAAASIETISSIQGDINNFSSVVPSSAPTSTLKAKALYACM
jgi:hypothetical protein